MVLTAMVHIGKTFMYKTRQPGWYAVQEVFTFLR